MYYQTPSMRVASPDYYLPGELIVTGPTTRAIKMLSGKYLTVLFDATDQTSDVILDQETFMTTNNQNVLVANRMTYDPPARCYAISILT